MLCLAQAQTLTETLQYGILGVLALLLLGLGAAFKLSANHWAATRKLEWETHAADREAERQARKSSSERYSEIIKGLNETFLEAMSKQLGAHLAVSRQMDNRLESVMARFEKVMDAVTDEIKGLKLSHNELIKIMVQDKTNGRVGS
jgi:hypothetical protein